LLENIITSRGYMEEIRLKYGGGTVDFRYDPNRFQVLRPPQPRRVLDDAQIVTALRKPIQSFPLTHLAHGKRSALLVVSDATRLARADLLMPHILSELQEGGIPPDRVIVILALGTHRPATSGEIAMLLGPAGSSRKVLQHDCRDKASLFHAGTTGRGTEVWLNRLLREHDLVVSVSAVSAHYFAGFGGGRKSIIPGLAGHETIVRNHLLAVDFENARLAQGVEPCRLDGNPVSEDMTEGVALFPPHFAVQTLLTPNHQLCGVWAGHWSASHRKACEEFIRQYGVQLPSPRKVAIVSPGGAPKDIDFIQSHKTIQYASRAVIPGGTIVLLARCPEGIGSKDFQSYFPITDVGAFLERLRKEETLNGQTATAFYTVTKKHRIIIVSELDPRSVQALGIEQAVSLEQAMRVISDSASCEDAGYIFPEGALTIPVLY
jgi:nickel-dependent lactate racemase